LENRRALSGASRGEYGAAAPGPPLFLFLTLDPDWSAAGCAVGENDFVVDARPRKFQSSLLADGISRVKNMSSVFTTPPLDEAGGVRDERASVRQACFARLPKHHPSPGAVGALHVVQTIIHPKNGARIGSSRPSCWLPAARVTRSTHPPGAPRDSARAIQLNILRDTPPLERRF
jgi:hypothetical protein